MSLLQEQHVNNAGGEGAEQGDPAPVHPEEEEKGNRTPVPPKKRRREEEPTARYRAPPGQDTFSLQGKVFVITGASKGIGAAVARHCWKHGAAGLLLVDVDGEAGRRREEELHSPERPCRVKFVQADLGSMEGCAGVMECLDSEFTRVDGLVNCAGVTTRGALADTSAQKWDTVLNINVRAPFLLSQHVSESMKRAHCPGSIVNISSVHSHGGGANMLPYSVSKAALVCLTKNTAAELVKFGIRVNAVNLGWTLTETEDALQTRTNGPNWVEEAEKTFPLGRLIQPHDVAVSVGFLLSDAAVMMTGSVIDMHPEVIHGCIPDNGSCKPADNS